MNKQTVEIESTQAFSGYNPTTKRLALVTFVQPLGSYFVAFVDTVGGNYQKHPVRVYLSFGDAVKEADAWLR